MRNSIEPVTRQVLTTYQAGFHGEVAPCPFCTLPIVGVWKGLGLVRKEGSGCVHFVGFVDAGGFQVGASFRGIPAGVADG